MLMSGTERSPTDTSCASQEDAEMPAVSTSTCIRTP